MENMIETKDVIQSFPIAGGKELVVLKNINIQIPTGKLTMLRGRSGSGKTTLMNLLSALDYPKSGEILFEGKPIQDLPEHDREQMRKTQIGFVFQSVALIPMMTAYENVEFVLRLAGYKGDRRKSTLLNLAAGLLTPSSGRILLDGKEVNGPGVERTVMFQEHALYPWLTVRENVEFGMKLAGVSKEKRQEKSDYYLKMVHLQGYEDYRVHEISGGMRQRVALARALVVDSEILLMDEPFSALDKQTSNCLREELQRIWMETKKTILFITHSAEEAVYLADRVVVLAPECGMVSEILPISLERPRHVYDPAFVELRHSILDAVQGATNRENKEM